MGNTVLTGAAVSPRILTLRTELVRKYNEILDIKKEADGYQEGKMELLRENAEIWTKVLATPHVSDSIHYPLRPFVDNLTAGALRNSALQLRMTAYLNHAKIWALYDRHLGGRDVDDEAFHANYLQTAVMALTMDAHAMGIDLQAIQCDLEALEKEERTLKRFLSPEPYVDAALLQRLRKENHDVRTENEALRQLLTPGQAKQAFSVRNQGSDYPAAVKFTIPGVEEEFSKHALQSMENPQPPQ